MRQFGSHRLCLLVIFSDVSILVQSVHLGANVEGKRLDVGRVRLIVALWWCVVKSTRRKPTNKLFLSQFEDVNWLL